MTDVEKAVELAKELVREGRSGDAGILAKALLSEHERAIKLSELLAMATADLSIKHKYRADAMERELAAERARSERLVALLSEAIEWIDNVKSGTVNTFIWDTAKARAALRSTPDE